MKSKFLSIAEVALILGAALSMQACYEREVVDPGPGYGYGYSSPVTVGDYDEHHVWHDRDWWVSNRADWVHVHHPDWVASRDHDHDYR